eukprot:1297015-Pyramimonas_sp.AAC.1
MYAGITVAFLGCEVQLDANYTNAALEAMRDAHALGCRIRSTIESFDPLHEGTKGLGNEVSETVRHNCSSIQEAIVLMHTSTEPHFSVKICLANSRFGFLSTDKAIGTINCLRKKKKEEESGPADPLTETIPAGSPADAAIMIAEEDSPSSAAASGLRSQRHSRPASRPRHRGGRQSHRTAPCAPVPASPAASSTDSGW